MALASVSFPIHAVFAMGGSPDIEAIENYEAYTEQALSDVTGNQEKMNAELAALDKEIECGWFMTLYDKPLLAIVIDDLGWYKNTSRFTTYHTPLTLAFLPHAPSLKKLTQTARDNGHEIMTHMPMEPFSKKPSERYMIKKKHSDAEVLKNLQSALDQFDYNHVGVNNHMGSRITSDKAKMRIILEEVKSRGLFFLDSKTTPKTVVEEIAKEVGVPYIGRDVFLDDEHDKKTPLYRLEQAARTAKRNGGAVVIGHPSTKTYRDIDAFVKANEKSKDVLIEPVSVLIKKNACQALLKTR